MLVGLNIEGEKIFAELEFACDEELLSSHKFRYVIKDAIIKSIIMEEDLIALLKKEVMKGHSIAHILKLYGIAKKDHAHIISHLSKYSS